MSDYALDLIFFILLVILQVLDAYTTLVALKSGKGTEANPVMRWLFDKFGIEATLLFGKVAFIVLAYYYLDWPIMAALIALYIWAVWGNFKVINK